VASDDQKMEAEDSGNGPPIRGLVAGQFARMLGAVYGVLSPLWAFGIYIILQGELVPRYASIPTFVGTAGLVAGFSWFVVAAATPVSITVGNAGVSAMMRTLRPRRRSRVFVPWSNFSQTVVFGPHDGTVALVTLELPRIVLGLTLPQASAVLRHPKCPIRNLPPALVQRLAALGAGG
jgi:hypothetical protein